VTRRRVVLLGSTGSIGRQALDVVRTHPERFEVAGLAAARDGAGLLAQADEFGVPGSPSVTPRRPATSRRPGPT
jgi:1-deoxy-D-xylulose 5-phosphate reductoisomerase